MSQKANPTLIGGFVLGALVLLVGGVLLFGKGFFFAPKRQQFVIYFPDSVNGLNVGAPVKLKGVTVGTVTDVRVQYDVENARLLTPVIIDFEPERVTDIGRQKLPEVPETQALIERGLRAQLQMQSLVTGQLYVEANFFPDTPVRLVGGETLGLPEIPSIPSTGEEIKGTVEEVIAEFRRLPLRETFDAILATVKHIEQVIATPEMAGSIRELHGTLGEIRKLVAHLDAKVDPMATTLEKTLGDTRMLVRSASDQLVPMVNRAEQAFAALTQAAEKAKSALATVENSVGRQNPAIDDAMEELIGAAQSIRVLSEYLQRQPQSLLFGKRDTEE
jgi:paraquat-inducible protein B